jgi:GrpB-like predicted nucleotidyltransferase (UPF0157 family)
VTKSATAAGTANREHDAWVFIVTSQNSLRVPFSADTDYFSSTDLLPLEGRLMLGLKHDVNILVDYDPEWSTEYARERERIVDALGRLAKGVEHYGSTAVQGMRAKPIIDILIGVVPFENWVTCKIRLERLGYDYAANAGVPRHHIFGRGRDTSDRTHLVHIVEFLGDEWRLNLALRDALRRDENLRVVYMAEKERAAAAAPQGRARYNELKGPFIDKIKAGLI